MKIGILSQNKEKNISGINKHTTAVLSNIKQLDKENEYQYVGRTWWLPVKLPEIPVIYDSSSNGYQLDYAFHAYNLDIIHSYYRPYKFSASIKCKKVITIHDLIPLLHPEWERKEGYDMFNGAIRMTAKAADAVIVDSEYTKKDVVEYYSVDEDKVHVVYCGLYPENVFKGNEKEYIRDDVQSGKYILSVCAINLNKNQKGLIKAFVAFKERHPDCDIKLVLVGSVRNNEGVKEELEKNPKVAQDIVYTGYVSDEELVWLYKNAYAFIYVSFYEGFGLPILEAMSVGRAVICSNVTSMPEVGGDAVEYCNPYDVESIVDSIENVVFDTSYKDELEKKAIIQAKKFSYRKAAEQTLDIYKMLV